MRRRIVLTVVAFAALAILGLVAIGLAFRGNSDVEVTRLVDLLDLNPGQTVAEIGAGSGWLTVAVAERMGPTGHVFSTELSEARRTDIEDAVGAAGLENVTIVAAGEHDTQLPDTCCDAIFMRRVYHHLSDTSAINASLQTALRPGGRLAVIEFRSDGWVGRLTGMGIAPEQLVGELSAAGFEHVETADWPGMEHYIALFSRP